MQQSYQLSTTQHQSADSAYVNEEQQPYNQDSVDMDAARASEQTRFHQGIMYVHIEHFYCTLEEQFDPSLQGQSFIVGTGTGRPNEPGRIIDVSPAAARLGLVPGMTLRRAHRIAPHTRFMPASYDHYQPILRKLKECYRLYSRIIESIPISDAFIDLRGSELQFETPVTVAERLCQNIEELGLHPQIGVASGKTFAELAALMSRKESRQGVLYIPSDKESAFIHTLPLSMLLKLRATHPNRPDNSPDTNKLHDANNRSNEIETKIEQIDPIVMAELVAHLRDFGVTTFAQIADLTEEGLTRRLGHLGGWLHNLTSGMDDDLVIPDAPPLSQNARVRFQHYADADETCGAIRRLADYLSNRLDEQRLKGQSIALILWPARPNRETQKLAMNGYEDETSSAEVTIGGQMQLGQHTDAADVIAHHTLMLFAHYHRTGMRYMQLQIRIGDIITATPRRYYPPSVRNRGRLTRKLQPPERS
jgi:nucleotidyltransferase/DNA polymerase involved in DNA repair